MNKRQDGFTVLEGLLVIVVIGVAVGFVWLALHARQNALEKSKTKTATTQTEAEDKKEAGAPTIKTYLNEEYGFSFDYPADWDLAEDMKELGRGHKEGSVTVISLNGTKITFSSNLGGKGGDCIDQLTNDHSTRVCQTVKIEEVEKLDGGTAEQPLYLVKGSLTESEFQGGTKSYFIDLQSRPGEVPKEGEFLTPVYLAAQVYSPRFSPGYIDISYQGDDDAQNDTDKFYKTREAKEVDMIFRTFKLR